MIFYPTVHRMMVRLAGKAHRPVLENHALIPESGKKGRCCSENGG
jgi:hypothetical protein